MLFFTVSKHTVELPSKAPTISGHASQLDVSQIRYDATLMQEGQIFTAKNWLPLHQVLRMGTTSANPQVCPNDMALHVSMLGDHR